MTVAADHVIDTVMAAVHAALLERYSFDARAFGQPVAQSEAIATMQSVSGVVARRYRSILSQRHADAGVESAA